MASFPLAHDPTRRIRNVQWRKNSYLWIFQFTIADWGVFITPDGDFLSAGAPEQVMAIAGAPVTTTTNVEPPMPSPPPLDQFQVAGGGLSLFSLQGLPANAATGRPSGQSVGIADQTGGAYFLDAHLTFSGGGSNDVHMDFSGLSATNETAVGFTWTHHSLIRAPRLEAGLPVSGGSIMKPSRPFGPL